MGSLQSWAEEEFGEADLGDLRRTKRAVELAAAMAECPGGRVTTVLRAPAAQEAAFRLLRNAAVDEAELARSSHQATLGRLRPGERFIVQGGYGPLRDGELERARRWGAELAEAMAEQLVPA